MALKALKCPNCGATLENFDKSINKGICPFCDSVVTDVPVKQEQAVKSKGNVSSNNYENHKIISYLTLAEIALTAKNYSEAEKYANMTIELEHDNAKGWFIKGKAAGWQSNNHNNRINESVLSFSNAIKYANENDTEFKNKIVDEFKSLVKAIVNLYTRMFSDLPDYSRRELVKLNIGNIYTSFKTFAEKSGLSVDVEDISQYIAKKINSTTVQAYNNISKAFGKDNSKKTIEAWKNYVKRSDNCIELLEFAIKFSENDPDTDFQIYKNLILIQEEVIYSKAYTYDAEKKKYVGAESLDWRSTSDRRAKIKEWKQKSHEVDPQVRQARAEEAAKKERIEKYWAEHPEEKTRLENEIETLEETFKNNKRGFLGMLSKEGKAIKAQIDDLKIELVKDR